MRNLIMSLFAGALVAGATFVPAHAAMGDIREAPHHSLNRVVAPLSPVREGRNVTINGSSNFGLEPYIARSIEQNARGNK